MPYTVRYEPYKKLTPLEKTHVKRFIIYSGFTALISLSASVATGPDWLTPGLAIILVPTFHAMPWEPGSGREFAFALSGLAYLMSIAVLMFSVHEIGKDLTTKQDEIVYTENPIAALPFLIGFVAAALGLIMLAYYLFSIIGLLLQPLASVWRWLDQP